MKNFKKILALVLTACLLLAITVVSVFATPRINLDTGDKKIYNALAYDFDTKQSTSVSSFKNTTLKVVYEDPNDTTSNKYAQVRQAVPSDAVESGYFYYNMGNGSAAASQPKSFIFNDYAVFDFAIAADAYLQKDGTLSSVRTENTVGLSFPDCLKWSLYYRIGSSGTIGSTKGFYAYGPLNAETEKVGYLSWQGSTVYRAALPTEINEWMSATVVYEIDNSINYYKTEDGSDTPVVGDYDRALIEKIRAGESEYKAYSTNLNNTRLHVFIDGEYIVSDTAIDTKEVNVDAVNYWMTRDVADIEKAGFYAARNYPINSANTEPGEYNGKYNAFSIGVDNVALNYYANKYDGELATYISSDAYKTQPLYTCSDVVYNVNYPLVKAALPELYTDANCETIVSKYATATEALEAAQAGQCVLINENTDLVLAPGSVKDGVIIKTAEGVTLTAGDKSAYSLVAADGYYTLSAKDVYFTAKVDGVLYCITNNDVGAFLKANSSYTKMEIKLYKNSIMTPTNISKTNGVEDPSKAYVTLKNTISIDVNGKTLDTSALTYFEHFSYSALTNFHLYSSQAGGLVIDKSKGGDGFIYSDQYGSTITYGNPGDTLEDNKLTIAYAGEFMTVRNNGGNDSSKAPNVFNVYGVRFVSSQNTSNRTPVALTGKVKVNIENSAFEITGSSAYLITGSAAGNKSGYAKFSAVEFNAKNTTFAVTNTNCQPVALFYSVDQTLDQTGWDATKTVNHGYTFEDCTFVGLTKFSGPAMYNGSDGQVPVVKEGTVTLLGDTKIYTTDITNNSKYVLEEGAGFAVSSGKSYPAYRYEKGDKINYTIDNLYEFVATKTAPENAVAEKTGGKDAPIYFMDATLFQELVQNDALVNGAVVKLLSDVEITNGFTYQDAGVYTFDINGKTLSFSNTLLFDMYEGVTFNVYSSKVGGKIISTSGRKDTYFLRTWDGAVINVGIKGDTNGKDAKLNVQVPMMLNAIMDKVPYPETLIESLDGITPATINIYGGNYSCTGNYTYAVFNARYATKLTIENATFYSGDDEMFSTDSRSATGLILYAKNSNFYTPRALIYGLHAYTSSAIFEDCRIVASTVYGKGASNIPGTYYVVRIKGVNQANSTKPERLYFAADTKIENIETYVLAEFGSKEGYAGYEFCNPNGSNDTTAWTSVDTAQTFVCISNASPTYVILRDATGNKLAADPTLPADTVLKGDCLVSVTNVDDMLKSEFVTVQGQQVKANLKTDWVYYNNGQYYGLNKSYNFVMVSENSANKVVVTFGEGGKTETWFVGSTITEKGADETAELYTKKFVGWTKDGEAITTLVAGEYTLTPVYDVVVNVPGIKLNLTANNGFIVNYYVPASYGVTADAKSAGTIEKGGTVYDIYTVAGISPNNVEGATIVLTVNVDGVDYTQTITVSLLDYFGAILAGEDDEAKTLVVNAVNYCNAVYNYVNGADYAEYASILAVEENKARIIAADAEAVDVDAQEQGVFGEVQFIISEGNVPMFAFTKLTAGKVSVKFTNIYGDEVEIICTEVTVDEKTYYAVAEMPVYEMVEAFEVYVNDAKVGNYSIANYAEATTDAGAKSIADALYGYGKAVANWKIED